MTGVLPCTCSSKYQDKTYGEGKRLHNQTNGKSGKGWRCTSCGKEKK
jgi:hypothetical protein